jgi:hypothetical protein
VNNTTRPNLSASANEACCHLHRNLVGMLSYAHWTAYGAARLQTLQVRCARRTSIWTKGGSVSGIWTSAHGADAMTQKFEAVTPHRLTPALPPVCERAGRRKRLALPTYQLWFAVCSARSKPKMHQESPGLRREVPGATSARSVGRRLARAVHLSLPLLLVLSSLPLQFV